MKVSVIATVKNEEASIGALLDSLLAQSRPPDEIVIADGGSSDRTREVIQGYANRDVPVRLLTADGANISEGRNAAIRAASGEIIAATDAGVRLVRGWLAELMRSFEEPSHPPADVVGGFFQPDARSAFELAMGATVLPALDQIDAEQFLPSSRSVAFRRRVWEEVGGYPEWLDYCEDVVFDRELRRRGYRFAFAPKALAYFRPRSNPRAFFLQYYRYARGDGKASLWARRHAIRYATYSMGPIVFLLGFWYKLGWLALGLAVGAYLYRPYRNLLPALRAVELGYSLRAILWVPAIRLIGDVAKMMGYPVGVVWRWRRRVHA